MAILMSPLVPAFWLYAASVSTSATVQVYQQETSCPQPQATGNQTTTILKGILFFDKKNVGETGERMHFEFYLDDQNIVLLRLYDYRGKEQPSVSQVPLSYVRAIQMIIEKRWKESDLSSAGNNAILTVLQKKKNMELLKECQTISNDMKKLFSKGDITITSWKAN